MNKNPKKDSLRTWIEISVPALEHNFFQFKKIVEKDCKLMAVIKSNAYGHGLVGCGKIFEKLGADYLGVDSVTEAMTLRENKIKLPILVLGYTLPERFNEVIKKKVSITISNFETFEALLKIKSPIRVHIKIDTGMHRQGFSLEQLPRVITAIKSNRKIVIEGIYSHFAAAKKKKYKKVTKDQIKVFQKACDFFDQNGIKSIKHLSATSGVLNYPEANLNMVRIGIGNYGLWPDKECQAIVNGRRINLKPALVWKTIVAEVKNAGKGEGISYDLSEILKCDSVIAVLPIGYWHGFRRQLSSVGEVLIKGKKAKVLGRVCMDMFVVDVTNIPRVKVGDEVVLIGRSGKLHLSAEDIANLCQTSNYETVTCINPLIKRYYEV